MTANSSILVTGGASGIGRACAERLAGDGAAIAIWDINEDAARAAAAELAGQFGVHATGQGVDVGDLQSIEVAAATTRESHPALRALVLAAGVDGICGLRDLEPVAWQRVIDINLNSLPFIVKAFRADLKASGNGAVVGISSINATLGNAANPAYSASKAGVIGVIRSLADDLSRHGIRANAISPGPIETPMLPVDSVDGLREAFESRVMLGRLGRPEEIANVARFLVSDESSYVTAAEIVVDGGYLYSQRMGG